jgi:hypothetical protein
MYGVDRRHLFLDMIIQEEGSVLQANIIFKIFHQAETNSRPALILHRTLFKHTILFASIIFMTVIWAQKNAMFKAPIQVVTIN